MLIVCAGAALLAGCSGHSNLSAAGSSSSGSGSGTGTGTTTYSMGNGTGSSFQSGMIGISSASVAAGGTTSLTVTVVDQTGTLYTAQPVTVTFSSTCISTGLAKIAPAGTSTAGSTADQVTSTTGTIDATYTATGCSGSDVITASAAVASTNLTATGTVTVAAAAIGSIQFISATPATIGLKGTGLNETSTVVFKVVDSSGGPRPGVTVSFNLNTTTGGLSLSPATQVSGVDGTVQTVVSSGTGHTSVIVTASIASPAHRCSGRRLMQGDLGQCRSPAVDQRCRWLQSELQERPRHDSGHRHRRGVLQRPHSKRLLSIGRLVLGPGRAVSRRQRERGLRNG